MDSTCIGFILLTVVVTVVVVVVVVAVVVVVVKLNASRTSIKFKILFDTCDCTWKNWPSLHNYKYLEIPFEYYISRRSCLYTILFQCPNSA